MVKLKSELKTLVTTITIKATTITIKATTKHKAADKPTFFLFTTV